MCLEHATYIFLVLLVIPIVVVVILFIVVFPYFTYLDLEAHNPAASVVSIEWRLEM